MIILQILRKAHSYFLECVLFIVRSMRIKLNHCFDIIFSKLVDAISREKAKIAFYSNVSVDEVAFHVTSYAMFSVQY